MTDVGPQLFESPAWVLFFMLAANAMFAGCLFHAIKVGVVEWHERENLHRPLVRLLGSGTQVLFLCGFVFAYWLLESGAQTFTPYYVYTPAARDLVPLAKFAHFPVPPDPITCPDYVRSLVEKGYGGIPVSVLLMEASLTYAGMWTALILGVGYRLVPLWAGLFVFLVDLLLDPVVAGKYDCQGVPLEGRGVGLGFWHWFLPTGPDRYLGDWFGVPLFNYAAWIAGPIVLISLAMIVQYLRGRVYRRIRGHPINPSSPVGREAAVIFLLFVIGVAVYLVMFLAPAEVTRQAPIPAQWVLLGLIVVVTSGVVVRLIRSYTTARPPNASLTTPPGALLILPLLALALEGLFLEIGGLVVVALVVLVLVVFLTLWPYDALVCRVLQRIIDVDRLIRVAYFGFPSTLVLLGAFSLGIERTVGGLELRVEGWQVGGLLTAALSFHVFAHVLKDVVDLPVDRSRPSRREDPLVRGAIQPASALALALVQIPVVVLVSWLLHASLLAQVALLSGLALVALYALYGRRCPWPLLTDLARALGWASLSIYGALVVDPMRESDNWLLVLTVAIFSVGFVLLIRGMDGGPRDLTNARPQAGTGSTRVYAFAIHATIFVLPALIALDAVPGHSWKHLELSGAERLYLGVLFAFVFLCSHLALARAVREREPRRDGWIRLWCLVVMQAPLLGFAPFLGETLLCVLLVAFYAPLLVTRQLLTWVIGYTHPTIVRRITHPPPRAPQPATIAEEKPPEAA